MIEKNWCCFTKLKSAFARHDGCQWEMVYIEAPRPKAERLMFILFGVAEDEYEDEYLPVKVCQRAPCLSEVFWGSAQSPEHLVLFASLVDELLEVDDGPNK